jgi:hypothetical protein
MRIVFEKVRDRIYGLEIYSRSKFIKQTRDYLGKIVATIQHTYWNVWYIDFVWRRFVASHFMKKFIRFKEFEPYYRHSHVNPANAILNT